MDNRQRKIIDIMDEFFDKQCKFHQDMKTIIDSLTPEVLGALSHDDAAALNKFLEPYKNLSDINIFHNPGQDIETRARAIIDTMMAGRSQGGKFILKAEFQTILNTIKEAVLNYEKFSEFLVRIVDSSTIKKRKKIFPIFSELLGKRAIIPVQQSMRYGLLLKEMIKQLSGDVALLPIINDLNLINEIIANEMHLVNEERSKNYRTSITQDHLVDLSNAINEFFSEHKRTDIAQDFTTIIKLNQTLKSLVSEENVTDTERMTKLRIAFMEPYVDIYVNERYSRLGHTAKRDILEFLDQVVVKCNLINVAPIEKDPSVKKDTPDARFLCTFISQPEACRSAAKYLFIRAMAEGIGGHRNENVYINAGKAIIRMGSEAVATWNSLVAEYFADFENVSELLLPFDFKSEGAIEKSYKLLVKDPLVRGKVSSLYYLEILLNLFKPELNKLKDNLSEPDSNLFSDKKHILIEQYEEIRNVIKELEKLKKVKDRDNIDVSALVHKAVLKTYIKAYLIDRGKGARGKGPFLTAMDDMLNQFYDQTGHKMFVGSDPNAKAFSSKVFSSIHQDELRFFVKDIFDHAVKIGFELPSQDTKEKALERKTAFLNAVKIVIKMGAGAIQEWNKLAARYRDSDGVGEEGYPFPDLMISQDSHRHDDNYIMASYACLFANNAFLKTINPTLVVPPQQEQQRQQVQFHEDEEQGDEKKEDFKQQ